MSDAGFKKLLLIVVLFAAGVRLWRSPWSASDLAVIPDSIEYALGAQRLVTLGRYDIEIEGLAYPPRSTPWFSLLLAPAYVLAPRELGIGIIVILALALCAVAAAFAIGERLAGEWGAVGAALALACFGEFRRGSTKIMTDVPALAFALGACVLYLRLRRGEGRSGSWLLAGVLCAAAFALRLEMLALCLPFLALAVRGGANSSSMESEASDRSDANRRSNPYGASDARDASLAAMGVVASKHSGALGVGRFGRALLLVAPIAAVVLANAIYNTTTLGSWTRSGYQFWLPDLHSDMSNILSPSFISANVATLVSFWGLTAIGFGSIGAWRLFTRRSAEARDVFVFFVFAALPGILFHLPYFYPDLRFHLLPLAILCMFAGAGLVTFLPSSARMRARWLLPLIALATIALPASPAPDPHRRIVAETIARETPFSAVIVTALEPPYLEPLLLRGTARRIVPFSRSVEYAGRRVPMEWLDASRGARGEQAPSASQPIDSRDGALACAFTADEDPHRIAEWVRSGTPVYLDASFIPKSYPMQSLLGDELELEPSEAHPWLSRVVVRR